MQAHTRATELANNIVENTAGPQPVSGLKSGTINVITGMRTEKVMQSNSLIHQLSEYKLAEIQFHASASVFKPIADSSDTALGLLLGKKE